MTTAQAKLELAKEHLDRVRVAWDPPDWADLSIYGLYCLEAAIDAAAMKLGIDVQTQHWARVDAARALTAQHGLPDVAELLRDLNEARKSHAYGDVAAPQLDAEEVATAIEGFVEAAASVVEADDGGGA